jgi:hypothetical protein
VQIQYDYNENAYVKRGYLSQSQSDIFCLLDDHLWYVCTVEARSLGHSWLAGGSFRRRTVDPTEPEPVAELGAETSEPVGAPVLQGRNL